MSKVLIGGWQPLNTTGRPNQIAGTSSLAGYDYTSATIQDTLSLRGYGGACLRLIRTPDHSLFLSAVYWEDQVLQASTPSLTVVPTFAFGDAAARTGLEFLVTWASSLGVVGYARVLNAGSPGSGSSCSVLASGSIVGASAGPTIVTDANTGYFLFTDAGGNLRIAKCGTLTSSLVFSTKLVGAGLTPARCGLAKFGSTLVVIATSLATQTYKVYTSTDDGTTWVTGATLPNATHVRPNNPTPIVQFKDASFWGFGYSGRLVNDTRLAITKDGGATWTDVQVDTNEPGGVAIYLVHQSHLLYQVAPSVTSGPGAALPKFFESVDGGQTWQTVPTQTIGFLGLPDPGAAYFGQSKLTIGPVASGGADGGISSKAGGYPFFAGGSFGGEWLLSTTALGLNSATGVYQAISVGWAIDETSFDPDAFVAATSANGPTLSLLAVFADGVFENGPTLSLVVEFAPSAAKGPTLSLDATYFPNRNQLGLANLLGTTQRPQSGVASFFAVMVQVQGGVARIVPPFYTTGRPQLGIAHLVAGPPPPPLVRVEPTVSRTSTGGWFFQWTEGSAPWQVWLDGLLVATTLVPSYDFKRGGYEDVPPDLDIVGPVGLFDTSESEDYPPYVLIQWRGIQSAFAYNVQQYQNSTWVDLHQRLEDRSGYYQWQSGPLQDDTTYLFRVTAMNKAQDQGTPIEFQVDVVRNPLHPAVSIASGSSGNVVVSP